MIVWVLLVISVLVVLVDGISVLFVVSGIMVMFVIFSYILWLK